MGTQPEVDDLREGEGVDLIYEVKIASLSTVRSWWHAFISDCVNSARC